MGTVGEKLRDARERSNRTIRDMSEVTKIRTDHLEALEEANFDVFSAPVYIRGFVRSYAGALRLNVPEILLELDEELAQTDKFKEPPRLTGEADGVLDYIMLQFSKINWSVALPVILLALLLFAAIFGYRIYQRARTTDPLQGLGPGYYQPPPSGDTLPLPVLTNR